MDLTSALVILSVNLIQTGNPAGTMLVEEVERRTQIHWEMDTQLPVENRAFLWLGTWEDLNGLPETIKRNIRKPAEADRPEGFSIRVLRDSLHSAILVIGNDNRGVLFGAGHLLRKLNLSPEKASLEITIETDTAPAFPLRGHQLGYRNTPNSYDAWDLDQWEQYYRDLIAFGTNSIELVSSRSNDRADSPHYPLPPLEMARGMSSLANKYDLDVWLWYPALEGDYSDPEVVENHLKRSAAFIKALPRLDHLFVPGGDPGYTEPALLIPLLEKQYRQLQNIHPGAGLWVSLQGFGKDWIAYFLDWINQQQPDWLAGLVYGPGVRMTLSDFRAAIPEKYPIRSYPDITHTFHCQYPVPRWDRAFALTEGREPINPRPIDQKIFFNLEKPDVHGWLTYSEGCNDDVNKAVWSALAWNPDTPIEEILRDYSRYFLGQSVTNSFADGLLALERNWRGTLADNKGVIETLHHFQQLEDNAPPAITGNWRFLMALYRAYYDAYLYRRLVYETNLEMTALDALSKSALSGSIYSMDTAKSILRQAVSRNPAPSLRNRVFELADELFRSIGLQLSVDKYQAAAVNRGANLDLIDFPLNNRRWLIDQFHEIRKLQKESERCKRIEELVHWTNPGPGGFYDDLGNLSQEPHLIRGRGFEFDPGVLNSPADDFELIKEPPYYTKHPYRYSWLSRASTLHGTPVRLAYSNLDPSANYRIRIVYPADRDDFVPKLRLTADNTWEVHPFLDRPIPSRPLEFDIPQQATSDGELELQLHRETTARGNGRGAQIAEAWLLKDNRFNDSE